MRSDPFSRFQTSRAMAAAASPYSMKEIFLEAVQAVQPHHRIRQMIKVDSGTITVGKASKDQREYALNDEKKSCYIVGFGKAVSGMAAALEQVLGDHLQEGVISVPLGSQECFRRDGKNELLLPENSRITVYEGAKDNIPDEAALRASMAICRLIAKLKEGDLLFVLVTGGGSALLPCPAPPVTLKDKSDLVRALSLAGADIKELNSVRKRLSLLKGGGLARLARPARVVSLILSDIIGDPLDFIAGAPTVANEDPPNLALEILSKYSSRIGRVPRSVETLLNQSQSEDDDSLGHVHNVLLGNIDMAIGGMVTACRHRGWEAYFGGNDLSGEARRVGQQYAQLCHLLQHGQYDEAFKLLINPLKAPQEAALDFVNGVKSLSADPDKVVCLASGGETTVDVRGTGRGGRNQELALAFSMELHRLTKSHDGEMSPLDVRLLSAGTDGIDGPTDAAGAVGDSRLISRAIEAGLNPVRAMEENDSNGFFSALDGGMDLVTVGHTGTNVMDAHLLCLGVREGSPTCNEP